MELVELRCRARFMELVVLLMALMINVNVFICLIIPAVSVPHVYNFYNDVVFAMPRMSVILNVTCGICANWLSRLWSYAT